MEHEKHLSSIEIKFTGDVDSSFTKALKKQLDLHKGVTVIDLLKFFYQSSLGPFHILDMMDEAEIRNWIKKNLQDTKPSDEPLIEELYGRKWVRVNLRPYKKKYGADFQRLSKAFMEAKGKKRKAHENEFLKLQTKLLSAIRKRTIEPMTLEPEMLQLLETFLNNHKKEGYPPIHHSDTYEKNNRPEYLVIPYSSLDTIA